MEKENDIDSDAYRSVFPNKPYPPTPSTILPKQVDAEKLEQFQKKHSTHIKDSDDEDNDDPKQGTVAIISTQIFSRE